MHITSIKVTQRVNTGQYEHLEFTAEAVLHEGDDVGIETNRVTEYVDWHAQKPLRDARARQCRAIVADANATAEKKAEAELWLRKYEERKASVESLKQ